MGERRKTDVGRFVHPSGRKLRENIWEEDEPSETSLWSHTFPSQPQQEIRFSFLSPSQRQFITITSVRGRDARWTSTLCCRRRESREKPPVLIFALLITRKRAFKLIIFKGYFGGFYLPFWKHRDVSFCCEFN